MQCFADEGQPNKQGAKEWPAEKSNAEKKRANTSES